MFKYCIIFLFSICSCTLIFAEPTPFELEINKTTYKELKKKYHGVKSSAKNKYSNGKQYQIDCSQISLPGIKNMNAIFNEKDILVALVSSVQKNRYDNLVDSLSEKYTIVSQKKAFVGDKYTRFYSDNTSIIIDSPHLSFELSIIYMHKDFERSYIAAVSSDIEKEQEDQTKSL